MFHQIVFYLVAPPIGIPAGRQNCHLHHLHTFHLGCFRRVLGQSPRAARHPDLLRVIARQEVYVGLPDVHQRHERQDPQTDRSQQPVCLQAHLQLEGMSGVVCVAGG